MGVNIFAKGLNVSTGFGQQIHYRTLAAWLLKQPSGPAQPELQNFGVKQ